MQVEAADAVVVGAGVVGLAVARALALAGASVLVLEAEQTFGSVTSSRNSEVIHAGIYYPTGSLKARLCVAGRERLYRYCAERGVAHRATGKLVVATGEAERAVLERYRLQAAANGAGDLALLEADAVAALEPAVRACAALHSPRTGIVDSHGLMVALLGDLEAAGGLLVCRTPVRAARIETRGFELETGGAAPMRLRCRRLVNAAGLGAQALARALEGYPPEHVPPRHLARGRYYGYGGRVPFRHLVYPVPEAGGLGVHATLDLTGGLRFGPDVEWIDSVDHGFDDSAREAFVVAIRRWFPTLEAERLVPGYTGVRPRVAGPEAGSADFRIDGPVLHGVPGLVQLFGIESPGLTASLAIADEVRSLLV
ncbi:MAG: FAD-dependent oxidoreductase [Pseudomonadales bacterium]|nr:FAD-dependent oxidoreductase [Pseudomonadales bacterium]